MTWSFIAKAEAKLFGGGDKRLALANPIASDLSDMRPSLLPGLLKAAQRNADRSFGDVALFEVGQCFASDEPEGQTIKAAAVRRGTARAEGVGRHWDGGAIAVDAFDAKADAMALLTALNVPTAGVQVVPGGPDWFHPGRSATLQFGPKNKIGAFGEIHPKILRALDLKGPLVAFEITLDALPAPKVPPDQDQAEADACRVPAGDPRLRLRRRRATLRPATSCAPRKAPSASSSPASTCSTSTRARHRPGQEVGRDRGHAAADREDADRCRDRGGVAEDRRRGGEEDGAVLRR